VDTLEAIPVCLSEASVRGGALLVLDDPGVGKTALLDTVTTAFTEAGDLVLRAARTAARAGRVLHAAPHCRPC
jgi:MoxR-like ATPase